MLFNIASLFYKYIDVIMIKTMCVLQISDIAIYFNISLFFMHLLYITLNFQRLSSIIIL